MTGRSLRSLPKAHLHLHLEGSARPETMYELATRAGLEARDYRSFSGWDDFLALYRHAIASVLTLDDLARLCRELVEDEAAHGVRYVEPHVGLLGGGYVPRFGSAEEVWSAVREAFVTASDETGVEVNVVVASIRDLPPTMAEEAASFAAAHAGDGIAAFGLAGSEHALPAAAFARAAAIAREAGLLVTPHAGELCGPESVVDALDELGASRIAHGVRASEDPDVLARLASEGVACDVCVTSNVALGVVEHVGDHPLPQLLAAGVPVTLGADDSLMFGSGVADEYELAREAFGLDDEALAAIARTSATASGASNATKVRILADIDAWLAEPV
jgi:adenosine deaminase